MIEHQVQWTAPSFLWAETANATNPEVRQTINQPAILRFATDSFMDEFLAVLETDPTQLSGLVAQPETWRGPTPPPPAAALLEPTGPRSSLARKLSRMRLAVGRSRNLPASGVSTDDGTSANSAQGRSRHTTTLKLYQAAHQRYYLLTACLVCGLTGLPDRTLDAGRQERATFVVRRLFPPGPPDVTAPLPAFDAAHLGRIRVGDHARPQWLAKHCANAGSDGRGVDPRRGTTAVICGELSPKTTGADGGCWPA